MSRGRLCCLGTSLKLKTTHAPYYLVQGTCSPGHRTAAIELTRTHTPAVEPSGEVGFRAQVPVEHVKSLCAAAESNAGTALGVQLAVSMASLEEVFIKLAGDAAQSEKALEQEERERKNAKKLKDRTSTFAGPGKGRPHPHPRPHPPNPHPGLLPGLLHTSCTTLLPILRNRGKQAGQGEAPH